MRGDPEKNSTIRGRRRPVGFTETSAHQRYSRELAIRLIPLWLLAVNLIHVGSLVSQAVVTMLGRNAQDELVLAGCCCC